MKNMKWEYLVTTFTTEKDPSEEKLQTILNNWGYSGWELVKLARFIKETPESKNTIHCAHKKEYYSLYDCIFKRQMHESILDDKI